MLGDTLTFTINAVAKALVKINQDKYSSEYVLREADGIWTCNVRHTTYKEKATGLTIDRHNVELIHVIHPVAPATQGRTVKSYLVFEQARDDVSALPNQQVLGFAGFFTAPTITKLINYES